MEPHLIQEEMWLHIGILQVIIGMVMIIIKEIHKEGEGNMRTLPDPLHPGERRQKNHNRCQAT